MFLSFSAESQVLSARLYAEGFSLSYEEAEGDLLALRRAGALPLTLSRGGTLLSQGLGIPIDVEGGRMLYLYALTTDRAARGQGLLRTLLKESASLARGMGFTALCLLPATHELSDSYRRMGFTEELSAGGAPHIEAPGDLSLRLDTPMRRVEPHEQDALYRALGGHMSRALFDFTLATLAPTVLPMHTEAGYALALAKDPRYALAAAFPARRAASHTLLSMPLCTRLPDGPFEPLPR